MLPFLRCFLNQLDDPVVKLIAILPGNLLFIHRSHGVLPAGAALLDTLLDFDVQIRKLIREPAIDLAFTLVMFTKTDFHLNRQW